MTRRATVEPLRRSEARSRALEAFRLLMLERGYRRVTIQSVLDRSGVGRATFYGHFRCKEDLLAASVQGLGAMLAHSGRARRGAGADDALAFVRPLFHHAVRSRRMLAVLAERDTDVLLREHLMRTFADLVRDEMASPREAAPDEATVQFLVGGLWGVMMWWSRVPEVSPDAAADAFDALARRVFAGEPAAVSRRRTPSAAASSPGRAGPSGSRAPRPPPRGKARPSPSR